MRTRNKLIHIRVSEEEYECITANADECKMQVAPYVRYMALHPRIVNLDYPNIREHTKELGEIRKSINSLIISIDASNNYLPREIETIVNLITEVFNGENRLLETIHNFHEKLSTKLKVN